MSRRTADASKAIRLAWEKEQQRVLEGEGTRDWTEKQQQDIIDRGKAYDEDGKAFEGQHMKSAAEYPEFQGEPDNIQFLTHQDHFEAHRGNWQNPTNWYYDPINRQFHDFGDGKYIPCEVIKLSAPICTEGSAVLNENNSTPEKKPVKSEPKIADEIKPETINAEKKTIAAKVIVRELIQPQLQINPNRLLSVDFTKLQMGGETLEPITLYCLQL